MNQIRLVTVDIDGTLTDENGVLGDAGRLAKDLCEENGVVFTLATGRVSASAETVARTLGIRHPVISNGGAAIKVPGGEYLVSHTVSPEAFGRALTVARKHGVERYAYTKRRYITETPGPHLESYSRIIGIPIAAVEDLCAHVLEGTMSLVLRFGRDLPDLERRVLELTTELQRVSLGDFRVNRSLPHLLEVTRPEACKGQALETLSRLLGIPLEQTMAIGDDFGDIPMLEKARVGVLVENAAHYLKRPGFRITRKPYSEGVYEAISEFVLTDIAAR